jgi:hypothetical protein
VRLPESTLKAFRLNLSFLWAWVRFYDSLQIDDRTVWIDIFKKRNLSIHDLSIFKIGQCSLS